MNNTPPIRICGNCDTVNTSNDEFCSRCGYSLDANGNAATMQGSPPTIAAGQGSPPTMLANRRVTGALTGGNLLAGRYRIVKLIGKGGFGAVYQATDEHFQTQYSVAIKEMSDGQLSAQEKASAIQDFRNEAELLIKLKHPNLPNVSDFFEEAGKVYLVMEFIEGKTLEEIQSDAKGPLDQSLVMGWALQLCTVLHYLHTRPQPIIFRDMKPSNVMVTADGEIKLIDFGIARVFKKTANRDTTLLGSRGYAPIEQHGRGQSDTRSDIYALGATLYDLLTNELPTDAVTRMVNPQLFVKPRQLNPTLSPVVEEIILKAMASDAKDRYQSAREMAQAIAASGAAPIDMTALPISNSLSGITATSSAPVTPQTLAAPTGGAAASVMAPPIPQTASPAQPRLSRRSLLIGGAVAAGAIVIGGGALYFSQQRPIINPPRPTGNALTVNFVYSTEKESWMQKAINDFNASNQQVGNKSVQIAATSQGSVEATDQILKGSLKPVAWSPASFLELNQLNTAWNTQHGQILTYTSGDYIAKSLVFTPLVFAVWQERADLLRKKYSRIDWQSIHQAVLLSSWSEIGGQAAWGQVKLGQTRPTESNSGLLSITLMAYSFYQTQRGLTKAQITDSKFQKYFQDLESAVQLFGHSSGTYLTNEVISRGPAAYDIIPIYESLVLTNEQTAKSRWQVLQPIYPDLNILSDNPFAIFNASWVTEEEKKAAQLFRDFLLSDQQQRNALVSGFRPTAPTISIMDSIANNPFKAHAADFNIPTNIQNQAQPPNGDVVDELLNQWTAQYGSAPSALSLTPSDIKGPYTNETRL
ncbi:serine/threonine-protein kinase [Dictyobacter kobayashii]|uniref:Protein kinase domain-containing protein n=1 Tax=Dictyobacter kobayashii TaxID=2014872 RepID=A0A402ALE1_9CHLR|nr:serine/threonine-protein kinase [Dictyobacter kobayashii]GCE19952.1 hypothetical protein KDK_37520 [Dictyobacter kobayashii]